MPGTRSSRSMDNGTKDLIRFEVEGGQFWDERERATIQQAALDIGAAIARDIQRVAEQSRRITNLLGETGEAVEPVAAIDPADAFLRVYGHSMRFLRKAVPSTEKWWGEARSRNLVWVFRNAPHSVPGDVPSTVGNRPEFSVHELGHVFEHGIHAAIGIKRGREAIPPNLLSRKKGFFQHGRFQQSPKDTSGEIFADMFIGWVYDRWETVDGEPNSPLQEMGIARKNFMDGIMIELIEIAINENRNR